MRESARIAVTETSQVGEARRVATAMAERAGFNETRRGEVAIVVTEAARNLVQHGGGGEVLLHMVPDSGDAEALQILALDRGPGMRSVADCLQDGFSTAGTPGEGLGAIARMADAFDIYSVAGAGAAVFAKVRARNAHPAAETAAAAQERADGELGVVSLAMPGETECGDAWAIEDDGGDGITRFLVADGLGHGPLAASASQAAVRTFHEDASTARGPVEILEAIHGVLKSSRGAAVAVAYVDTKSGVVRFAGLGNVAAALVTSGKMQNLISHNGTAGGPAYRIQEFTYTSAAGAILVLASDGVSAQWRFDRYPGLLARHPALIAGVLYRDYGRGRDDVTVVAAQIASDGAK
jgi:anti-sigma regulatory factor (Ser/Thr protein kinase)